MSVYAVILEWSKGLSDWQRDALRRLVTGPIDDQQLSELEALSLKPFGFKIAGFESLAAQPLLQAHLPIGSPGGDPVSLDRIADVSRVNLISPDAELTFGDVGLTIIYGYNGSGKSGYVRILKRICRARDGGSVICPNIFEAQSGAPAMATIGFVEGTQRSDHVWREGEPAPAQFGKICIFDSGCAEFYVSKENDVAYRPFGLDLFDKLAAVSDSLRRRLETRKGEFALQCPAPPPELILATALKGIHPLSAKTNVALIDAVITLTTEEDKELAMLKRSLLEADPIRKVAALRGKRGLLQRPIDFIKTVASILNEAKVKEYKTHTQALDRSRAEAKVVSEEAFTDLLPETGGELWKGLWNHARKFALVAYPADSFPFVGEGALCLLCQQPLTEQAKSKFLTFEAFVKQEVAAKLQAAEEQVRTDLLAIRKVLIPKEEEDVLNELRSYHEEWVTSYLTFKAQSSAAIQAICIALEGGPWDDILLPNCEIEPWQQAATALDNEIAVVAQNDDPKQREVVSKRVLEFEARKWISTNQGALKEDIDRLKKAQAVASAIGTTATTAISRKSTEMTAERVTHTLIKAVEEELAKVNASHLQITLVPRSSKGSTSHRIDIKGRKVDKIGMKEIVSEGEFRAIAIAAFFAELSQSGETSAIVVDDPVSSLDHLHRERVAARLSLEAKRRQVIVFTHDVLFLRNLMDAAEADAVPLELRQVTRGEAFVGLVSQDVPWETQKIRDRIDFLRRTLLPLKAQHSQNRSIYESQGRDWYGHMREVWEVAVEELALNQCVQRLNLSVQTQRLKKVIDLTDVDYVAVDRGMTQCSRWLRGHSKPMSDTTPFPNPDVLESDLKELEVFVNEMRKRRN